MIRFARSVGVAFYSKQAWFRQVRKHLDDLIGAPCVLALRQAPTYVGALRLQLIVRLASAA
jgi:hypothetical protein